MSHAYPHMNKGHVSVAAVGYCAFMAGRCLSEAWLSDDMARGLAALSTGIAATTVRDAAELLAGHADPEGVAARLCTLGLSVRGARRVVEALRALRDSHHL